MKIKQRMRTQYAFFLALVFSTLNISAQTETVEGLSYLDGNPISVELKNGSIVRINHLDKLSDPNCKLYISPGLIDNQVNGYAGVSFAFGGATLSEGEVLKATQVLWQNGVTTYLPTLTTNAQEVLVRNLKVLASASNSPKLLGSIPGVHLEGPYLNPEDGYRGAHPREFVCLPDWNEFLELYEASGKRIVQITLAPDIPGAQEFIKKCKGVGVVVAVGHHNANAEQLNQAVKNGARISTHLGNGCANMINRHRNPLWPQLANDDLMISIICDGFHLLPEEISTFFKVKGVEKTILTSDVTSYAGLEPGEYVTSGGDSIELTPEGKLQFPAQQVLYGSASPLSKSVGHIIEVTGCSLADAIQMGSTNPAKLYGLTDRGELLPGRRADLILFSMDNGKMNIEKTYVNGQLVYSRSPKKE